MHVGYGDSSHTADGKYIIATFRADANLSWVIDLRSFFQIAELKYSHYAPQERRYQVQANAALYRNVIRGLSEAEITIIDQERYVWSEYLRLRDSGAEVGNDFTYRDILNAAAQKMLRDSPFGLRDELESLPAMQRRDSVWDYTSTELQELPRQDLSNIHRRAGGKYKDAIILSARAHSMLSPSEFFELKWMAENPYMRGSLASRMEKAASIGHVFDHEHGKSLPVLNELVSKIAQASGVPYHAAMVLSLREPVREEASHLTDHVQAADFAAGWAAELLLSTDSDFRALAAKVRWVSVNGILWSPR
jgi:hypothetical protein